MTAPIELDTAALRAWPLPSPAVEGDKEARGRVLIVGGSREVPGAPRLAAEAALRAGCGKVCLAVPKCLALPMGLDLPEARVLALPATASADIDVANVSDALHAMIERSAAVLIGPGLLDGAQAAAVVEALLPRLGDAPLILDASAMDAVPPRRAAFRGPVLLTPHAGEMAHLTGAGKSDVQAQAETHARRAAARWNAVIVLKGRITHIAAPDGRCWRNRAGNVGLATSGSGDVLSGLIAGLLAQGVPAFEAASAAVWIHAEAATRFGPGLIAEDLPLAILPVIRGLLGQKGSWGYP